MLGTPAEILQSRPSRTWTSTAVVPQTSAWKPFSAQPGEFDGSIVEGMLLFGWKDKALPEASAFLLHE